MCLANVTLIIIEAMIFIIAQWGIAFKTWRASLDLASQIFWKSCKILSQKLSFVEQTELDL